MNKKYLFGFLFLVGFLAVGISLVSAAFFPGDRVVTTWNLNVRQDPSPSSSILGVQPGGSLGTVQSTSSFWNTYNVNFDAGVDGWVSGLYLAIPSSTPSSTPICGDNDGNGSVSIGDAVYVINYVNAGGPAPSPLWKGDVNHDGMVNISDAVYLINYIFSSGPAPSCSIPVSSTSTLSISSYPLGLTSNRVKSAVDNLASIYFGGATGTDPVYLDFVNISFRGTAPSSTFIYGVKLYNPSNGNLYSANPYICSAPTSTASACRAVFNLNGLQLSPSTNTNLILRVDSLSYTNPDSNGVSQTLSASIDYSSDVWFHTGSNFVSRNPNYLGFPHPLNSVSYAPGGTTNVTSTLTAYFDTTSGPVYQYLVMGSTGNNLGNLKLSASGQDVAVNRLNVFQVVNSTSSVKPSFNGLYLYKNGVYLSSSGPVAGSGYSGGGYGSPGYYYKFNFSTPVVIPKDSISMLDFKGDVASYASSGATDNSWHNFKVSTSNNSDNDTNSEVVDAYNIAVGSSSKPAIILPGTTSTTSVILRSKLTVTATPQGLTTGRAKNAIDDLATINFMADAAGAVRLQSVYINMGGSAPSGINFFSTSGIPVKLYDPATGTSYSPSSASAPGGYVRFTMNDYVISAGTTKSFILRLNTLPPYTNTAVNGVSQTLWANIAYGSSVTFATAESGGTSGVYLLNSSTPINLNSVSYAAGTTPPYVAPVTPAPTYYYTPTTPTYTAPTPVYTPTPVTTPSKAITKQSISASAYDSTEAIRDELDRVALQLVEILSLLGR